jgi:hypothetical protein
MSTQPTFSRPASTCRRGPNDVLVPGVLLLIAVSWLERRLDRLN